MRRRTTSCAIALLLVLGEAIPLPAHAQPAAAGPIAKPSGPQKPLAQSLSRAAKIDFDGGKLLASDGDFAGALIKFDRAYEESSDYRVLWNVAYCEKNLRHYARTIATLNRYLAEGEGRLGAKDRKDAQEIVQTLEPFTTKMTFLVEDGAQIFVDNNLVGTSPLPSGVVLDIGERHVRVVKEGFKPFEKTLPVGGVASVAMEVKLEKDTREGRLIVNAPANALLTLDEKPIGTGKADLRIEAGGHQLRASAPGMRVYQTEVVIQDKETRSVDLMLEKEGAADKPKIRVIVGCAGPEPRGPDDGLVVYLDGPETLAPTNVKKVWSEADQRNIVEYVEYPANAGSHVLRARIPDCTSLETNVSVDPASGASVTGALRTDTPLLLDGPEGAPGFWRAGLDLWVVSPGRFQFSSMPEAYQAGVASTGVSLGGGIVTRWFGLFARTAFGAGSATRATTATNFALPESTGVTTYATTLRPSFRVPLNVVSLDLGLSTGFYEMNISHVYSGALQGSGGVWAGVDVQPTCDWGGSVSIDYSAITNSSPVLTLQAGVFFEPNSRCRRERSTRFGLFAGRSEDAPKPAEAR